MRLSNYPSNFIPRSFYAKSQSMHHLMSRQVGWEMRISFLHASAMFLRFCTRGHIFVDNARRPPFLAHVGHLIHLNLTSARTRCGHSENQELIDTVHLPTVVPAECIVYFKPLFFSNLCTSAICADTLAVGVPRGIRQKSAVAFGGVFRDISDMV